MPPGSVLTNVFAHWTLTETIPGNWRDIVPIPENGTFEALAIRPGDEEERNLFINFMTGMLDWLPEERLDSFQVFSHLWIYRFMPGNGEKSDDESGQKDIESPPTNG